MSDQSRTVLLSHVARRLLVSATRRARAPIYLDLARELVGTGDAIALWRRRDGAHRVSIAGDRVKRETFAPRTDAYDAIQLIEQLAEGEQSFARHDLTWLPADRDRPVRLVLPEGRALGALRLLVPCGERAGFSELYAILRALRPHWIKSRRLRREAAIDHLTGVFNYGHLRRYLKRLCTTSTTPFSVIMLDLDHLRDYNARFGHLMGSQVLAQLGGILKKTLRNGDFVAKYGGDEFVVILRGASRSDAADVALRVKNAVCRASFFGVSQGFITCSFGVASFDEDGDTFETILRSANEAIFEAKNRGRNTIVVAGR